MVLAAGNPFAYRAFKSRNLILQLSEVLGTLLLRLLQPVLQLLIEALLDPLPFGHLGGRNFLHLPVNLTLPILDLLSHRFIPLAEVLEEIIFKNLQLCGHILVGFGFQFRETLFQIVEAAAQLDKLSLNLFPFHLAFLCKSAGKPGKLRSNFLAGLLDQCLEIFLHCLDIEVGRLQLLEFVVDILLISLEPVLYALKCGYLHLFSRGGDLLQALIFQALAVL